MPEGELPFLDERLDFVRETKEPQGISDRSSIAADAAGDLLLGQSQPFDEPLIGLGFLDGIEVFALDVLNEREFQHLFIRDIADDGRDLQRSSQLSRSPSAFPSDDLIAKATATHDDRLYQAVSADRISQLAQPLFIISSARLIGTRINEINIQLDDLFCEGLGFSKKSFKSSAEGLSRHD